MAFSGTVTSLATNRRLGENGLLVMVPRGVFVGEALDGYVVLHLSRVAIQAAIANATRKPRVVVRRVPWRQVPAF